MESVALNQTIMLTGDALDLAREWNERRKVLDERRLALEASFTERMAQLQDDLGAKMDEVWAELLKAAGLEEGKWALVETILVEHGIGFMVRINDSRGR